MTNERRLTIGVLTGYQVYGNMSDRQTIEGNSISDYLLRVHQGILRAGKDLDCNLLIGCGLGSPPLPEHPYPAWFNWSDDATFVPVGPWNTDGLIVLTPVISDERQKRLRELREGGFPIVFCGVGDAPAVIADDAEGIRSAVRHMVEHGHRRIAYIAGYEKVEGHSGVRFTAYLEALRELGLEEHPELIVYGQHTIQGGRAAMRRLLDAGVEFSAVVTSDYSSALGAMRVLHESGLRIPQDVALIGFDDYLDAQAQTPPLTTVHIQCAELGYRSVELLRDYIHGRRNEPATISVQQQLVLRSSCGCTPESLRANVVATLVTDDEIIQRMTESVLRGTYHLQSNEAQARFAELLKGFRRSLRQGDKKIFFSILSTILNWIAERGDDAYVLQDALAILPQNANAVGNDITPLLMEAELHISDYARTQSARHMIHKANATEELGVMTSRLLFTLDETEIPRILSEHLPRLNIAHAEIFSVERDEEDVVAWSLLWEQEQVAGSLRRRFPSRQFPLRGLYPHEQAYQSILLPLLIKLNKLGIWRSRRTT